MTKAMIKHHIKTLLRYSLNAASPLFSRISTLDADTARKKLLEVCPIPNGTTAAKNRILPPSVDLQIVIPAYNVEDYLEECMDSVLSQKTTYSYHVVLVDDGAKDGTPAICDKYADDPRVTVIHQANRGLSGARNTGFREIFGTYLMFVDSDDILLDGAIQSLLDTAYAHDCDLVEGSACYLQENSWEIMHRFPAAEKAADPYASLHGHAWGKLYKAELFETLCFPEGFWYEDSIMTFLIFPRLANAWVTPHLCYGYRVNQAGIVRTSHGKPRSVETYWLTEQLMETYASSGFPVTDAYFRSILHQFRLNQHRVADLSEEIQESVFVLSCQLLARWFPENMTDKGYTHLLKALRSRDFGAFTMCCKLF